MTIGYNIKMARIAKGWTQDELAAESGISKNSISKYETDTVMPRMPKAKAIARALGVTYEDLSSGNADVPLDLPGRGSTRDKANNASLEVHAPQTKEEWQEIIEGFSQLPESVQKGFMDLAKMMIEEQRKNKDE